MMGGPVVTIGVVKKSIDVNRERGTHEGPKKSIKKPIKQPIIAEIGTMAISHGD